MANDIVDPSVNYSADSPTAADNGISVTTEIFGTPFIAAPNDPIVPVQQAPIVQQRSFGRVSADYPMTVTGL